MRRAPATISGQASYGLNIGLRRPIGLRAVLFPVAQRAEGNAVALGVLMSAGFFPGLLWWRGFRICLALIVLALSQLRQRGLPIVREDFRQFF